MREVKVKIHSIEEDGLPDMEKLCGRVAFLWDGELVSGWPLTKECFPYCAKYVHWETSDDALGHGEFGNVTHWIEFPKPFWEYE